MNQATFALQSEMKSSQLLSETAPSRQQNKWIYERVEIGQEIVHCVEICGVHF